MLKNLLTKPLNLTCTFCGSHEPSAEALEIHEVRCGHLVVHCRHCQRPFRQRKLVRHERHCGATSVSSLVREAALPEMSTREVAKVDRGVTCPWQKRWSRSSLIFLMEGRQIRARVGDCFVKTMAPGQAVCNWCDAKVSYGNKGKRALITHMKLKTHVTKLQRRLRAAGVDIAGMDNSNQKKIVSGDELLKSKSLVAESEADTGFANCEHCNLPFSTNVIKLHERMCPSRRQQSDPSASSGSLNGNCPSTSQDASQTSNVNASTTEGTMTPEEVLRLQGTEQRPYNCALCRVDGFERRSAFVQHCLEHNHELRLSAKLPCPYCGRLLSRPHHLQSHVLRHALRLSAPCARCGLPEWRMKNVSDGAFWLQRHHECMFEPGEALRCRLCPDKVFKDTKLALLHAHLHAAQAVYPCPSCPLGFATRHDRLIHRFEVHRFETKGIHRCAGCRRKIRTSIALAKHQAAGRCSARPRFCVCYGCGHAAVDQAQLNKHFCRNADTPDGAKLTSQKVLTCPFCHAYRAQSPELAKHMAEHVGDEVVKRMGTSIFMKCFFCGTNCRNIFNLVLHQTARHRNSSLPGDKKGKYQKVRCLICDDSFYNLYQHNLSVHPNISVTGPAITIDLEDDLCDPAFIDVSREDTLPRACPLCSVFCADLNAMKAHLIEHAGPDGAEDAFHCCFLCKKECVNIQNLLTHLAMRHGNESVSDGIQARYEGARCSLCGENAANMYLHMRTAHPDAGAVTEPAESSASTSAAFVEVGPKENALQQQKAKANNNSNSPVQPEVSPGKGETVVLICPVCQFSGNEPAMRDHVAMHLGPSHENLRSKTVGQCSVCQRQCGNVSNLISHVRARHRGQGLDLASLGLAPSPVVTPSVFTNPIIIVTVPSAVTGVSVTPINNASEEAIQLPSITLPAGNPQAAGGKVDEIQLPLLTAQNDHVVTETSQLEVNDGAPQRFDISDDSLRLEISDDTPNEILEDESHKEVIGDTSQNKVTNDSAKKKVIGDTAHSEVTKDSAQNEVTNDSAQAEVISDTAQSEVIGNATLNEVIENTSPKDITRESPCKLIIDDQTQSEVNREKSVVEDAMEVDQADEENEQVDREFDPMDMSELEEVDVDVLPDADL